MEFQVSNEVKVNLRDTLIAKPAHISSATSLNNR